MKMLMIVFRDSLEEELMKRLKELKVKAFTKLSSVTGASETGTADPSLLSSGTNSIVLTALAEDHAEEIIKDLHVYRDQLTQRQHGAYIPLRVFVLPCEQVV